MNDPATNAACYRELLRQTQRLYRSSAERIVTEHPELAPRGVDYVERLDDLHRGLVLRVYLTVCEADHQWTAGERDLAVELCEHLWGRRLSGRDLNQAIQHAAEQSKGLAWESLVGPFARLAPLRDRVAELETLLVRQSNLVARIDGVLTASERHAVAEIAKQLQQLLGAAANPPEPASEPTAGDTVPWPAPADTPQRPAPPPAAAPERSLEDVLAELDSLVGLDSVKQEVRSIANYLAMQQRRGEAGLPTTDISLHLVFAGNPGTGKTTVARLFGEAMRAMGVLPRGALVETDRSGLVAEYAGQTGPKTNKKVDEALGGVLFVDEAYGLAAAEGDDPFGAEALATLLKRAEDDRRELAVILAGYPAEMRRLLAANPGLGSRFSRTVMFSDYTPLELCRIFGRLMEVHHYRVDAAARLSVVRAVTRLHAGRDRHFGNGRAVRNLFERAILRMANRLAESPSLTDEELVTLQPSDLLPDEPGDATPEPAVRITCPACELTKEAAATYLGAALRCPGCGERFTAEWGELAE